MENLFLGLMFDIYNGLCTALNTLFTIFLNLASTSTKVIDIDAITQNIYVLMSVIMIFYVTINLLTYIASPEKLTEKAKGGTKILINVVITLALLVFTPTVFSLSRDLQTAVLKENVLGKVILSMENEASDDDFLATSQMISRTLTRAFLTPKGNDVDSDPIYSDDYMLGNITDMSGLRAPAQDTANYNFNWIMAIVSAAFLCILVINFLFDIAIRIIKLMFMEIIAPVPILMYTFKSEHFSKWLKETIAAYVSLFIRLALIYFVVYLVYELSNPESKVNIATTNPVIFSFIVIGALLFAKQLPKLLADVFGIKMEGSFSLNPLARIREVPLVGSAVQTAGAAVGGLVTGASLGYRAAGGVSGIVNGFKGETGAEMIRNGLKNFGTIPGMALRGTAFGGRAGFKQTSLLGTAVKDQKLDKTAYSAGASAVAQAITGNSNASSGIFDRVFNDMATELNRQTFEQNKAISLAEKAYNEELTKLANLQDSQREIISKKDVSFSRMTNYNAELTAKGADLATFRTNMSSEISTRVANEGKTIDQQIQQLNRNRDSMLRKQLTDAATAASAAGKTLSTSDIANITQTFENSFNQTISNLQIEKTNLRTKITNQLKQEEVQLVNEYNDIVSQFKTEQATYNSYDKQSVQVASDIAAQTTVVNTKKADWDEEKNKLKAMHGPYEKK